MTKVSLFSQIITRLDKNIFKRLVNKHQTDKYKKGFNRWTHLVSMLFCQFAKSQSVRDISNGLRSATGNINHLGVQKTTSESSLNRIENPILLNHYSLTASQIGYRWFLQIFSHPL